jgi:hypothetical protein
VAITASTLRRNLRDAWDDSQATGKTLYEQLRLREREANANLKGGAKSSISAAGTSVSFTVGQHTAIDDADCWTALVDLYSVTLAALGDVGDEALRDAMLGADALQECTSYRADFSQYNEWGGR